VFGSTSVVYGSDIEVEDYYHTDYYHTTNDDAAAREILLGGGGGSIDGMILSGYFIAEMHELGIFHPVPQVDCETIIEISLNGGYISAEQLAKIFSDELASLDNYSNNNNSVPCIACGWLFFTVRLREVPDHTASHCRYRIFQDFHCSRWTGNGWCDTFNGTSSFLRTIGPHNFISDGCRTFCRNCSHSVGPWCNFIADGPGWARCSRCGRRIQVPTIYSYPIDLYIHEENELEKEKFLVNEVSNSAYAASSYSNSIDPYIHEENELEIVNE